MLILDTLPLVDFFKDESEITEKIIQKSEENGEKLAISVVTLTELYYILAREKGEEFAKVSIENIKSYAEPLIFNEKISKEAGKLKFKYSGKDPKKGMPLADCIIAATVLENNATLVTPDDHFKKVEGLKICWA